MFDIDNFKAINDSYATWGDKVLVDFTRIVDAEIRECDFFSRWGGEEFVLILPGTNKEDAERLANRLRIVFAAPILTP